MYNHTCFASYLHLRVGNVRSEYAYWLLEGNECSTAGGFPSNPILSGSAPNRNRHSVQYVYIFRYRISLQCQTYRNAILLWQTKNDLLQDAITNNFQNTGFWILFYVYILCVKGKLLYILATKSLTKVSWFQSAFCYVNQSRFFNHRWQSKNLRIVIVPS